MFSVVVPYEGRVVDKRNAIVQLKAYTYRDMFHIFDVHHVGHGRCGYVLRPLDPLSVFVTRLVSGQFPLLSIAILEPARDISHLFPIRKQHIVELWLRER